MISQAKIFLQTKINEGKINPIVLNNKKSAYWKIRDMCEKYNPSYVFYFVKKYYNEYITIEKIKDCYRILKELKVYNITYNVNSYHKKPFKDFYDLVQKQKLITTKNIYPGIILNDTPYGAKILKDLKIEDYIIILAASITNGVVEVDLNVVAHYGSPKWCIKKPTFAKKYIPNNEHLQYICIHKDIYNLVLKSIRNQKISNVNEKLVPLNYGTNHKISDQYPHIDFSNKDEVDKLPIGKYQRFGITTKPQMFDSIFNYRKTPFLCFDDWDILGEEYDVELFAKHTNIKRFDKLDILVRKELHMCKSQFQIECPTVEQVFTEYIQLDKIDFNKLENNDIEERVAYQVMFVDFFKLMNYLSEYKLITDEFQNNLYSFLIENKNILKHLIFILPFLKDVSSDIEDNIKDIFSSYEKPNILAVYNILHTILEIRENFKINSKIIEVISNYIIENYYIKYITNSWVSDKPLLSVDFKRTVLCVYNTNRLYVNIDALGALGVRQKLFKLVCNYLLIYEKDILEGIIKGIYQNNDYISWDNEISFITKMLSKDKNKDYSDDSFLNECATKIFITLPRKLSRLVNGEVYLPTHSEIFDYIETFKDKYNPNFNIKSDYVTMFNELAYCLYVYFEKVRYDLKEKYSKLAIHEDIINSEFMI